MKSLGIVSVSVFHVFLPYISYFENSLVYFWDTNLCPYFTKACKKFLNQCSGTLTIRKQTDTEYDVVFSTFATFFKFGLS